MLWVLLILNLLNLGMVGFIIWRTNLGFGAMLPTELPNVRIIGLLTIIIFIEISLVAFLESGQSNTLVMIEVLPDLCEYLFLFKLFAHNLLSLHLPRERTILLKIFGTLLAIRVLLYHFYLDSITILNVLVPTVEVLMAVAFIYSAITHLRHLDYLKRVEVPKWEEEGHPKDCAAFQITAFHDKMNIYTSSTLLSFALNGLSWVIGSHILTQITTDELILDFEMVSLYSRVAPHIFMLINYLWLYFRDRHELIEDQICVFELKELLVDEEEG